MAVRRPARAAMVLPGSPGVPAVVRASGMKRLKLERQRKRELVRVVQVGQIVCGDTGVVPVSLRDRMKHRLDERLSHPLNLDERPLPLLSSSSFLWKLFWRLVVPRSRSSCCPRYCPLDFDCLESAFGNLDHERRDVEPAERYRNRPRTARPGDERSAVERAQDGHVICLNTCSAPPRMR